MSEAPVNIFVWVCDLCGYWREARTTGVHQLSDPENPSGKMLLHELREAEYVAVGESEQA